MSAGGTDIFLAKYGRSGELRWIVRAGGADDDSGQALDFDRAGNVYLTGWFTNSATFGSTDGATTTVTGTAQATIFLAKYRPSGALVWVQTGDSPFDLNNSYGVAVDAAEGAVYVTGRASNDTTFSSANGENNTVPGNSSWHMFLVKYDTSGNFQWGQTNQAEPNSFSNSVAVDAKHNAYVTGWLEDATTFSSKDGNAITVTGFSSQVQTFPDFPGDGFLAKYDRDGNVKWVNHFGGYKGMGSAVAISPTGEASIVGFIGNIGSGSPSQAETIVTSQPPGANLSLGGGDFTKPYNQDVLIATYDAAGVLQRALRRGGSGDEVATGAAYDHKGNLYVTELDLANNQPNLFVRKYSGGKLLWKKTALNAGIWTPNNTTISPAVSVDHAGRVFVTGGYQGTASFGGIKLHSVGSLDIFVAELDQD